MTREEAYEAFLSSPNAESYIAEADFGYTKILPEVSQLPPGSSVLEVGAGAGILLSRLALDFPEISFQGLEPMGDGFDYIPSFHTLTNTLPNAEILSIGYEDSQASKKYDLIFLVNVFEHLPDWRDFLERMKGMLAPGGTCILLCPNYSFPYEPHFQLPILAGKSLTYAVMKKKIGAFEEENRCSGLWNSLNFVKYSQVRKQAKRLNLDVKFEKAILEELILRFDTDAEFARRQRFLKLPVKILKKLGLVPLLMRNRMLERFLPYMHLRVSVKPNYAA